MLVPLDKDRRGEYITSITVVEPDDVSVLDSEKMWDIFHYVHGKPLGVRPKEIADKFEMRINQAYEKLKKLEKAGYLLRLKRKGKPGKEVERKTLLYFSKPWGEVHLDEDFEEELRSKYGKLVMEQVRPALLNFFKHVLKEMNANGELKPWFPSPHENLCPDCGLQHQAVELFFALSAFAMGVTYEYSYEFQRTLLDNGYLTRKEFKEYTAKSDVDEEWVLTDKPTIKQK